MGPTGLFFVNSFINGELVPSAPPPMPVRGRDYRLDESRIAELSGRASNC